MSDPYSDRPINLAEWETLGRSSVLRTVGLCLELLACGHADFAEEVLTELAVRLRLDDAVDERLAHLEEAHHAH